MNLKDFLYELPREAIARYPAEQREDSRLMVVPRRGGPHRHSAIRQLPDELRSGDLLVVNDTRVLPWRLFGNRLSGGKVEILLVREEAEGLYRAMVSANRPLPEGEQIRFWGGLEATLGPPGHERALHFSDAANLSEWLEKEGELPIPPYLNRREESVDRERYQTVFARNPGAIAAPTAGLHFSAALNRELESIGVGFASLTLHVGPGTFRPVKSERIEKHEMDSEAYFLSAKAASKIEKTRRAGGRVIAVGTTVVRVLETVAKEREGDETWAGEATGETRLFILPGHSFRLVDGLLTNFHLPGSTLLMLVAAFAGRERILEAYRLARDASYRFYSYGDAMLII
ncbi:MAG: tRNA preQ1(34) S-adenosylmethionine ribosyltransferase-isomerase QueA [Nitrospinota bacterium]|nr:tRNA preQ1(34) S-adenosylmethionine ribosyltransferase-isomerase QueA [Nitrospinota bacterium]